LSRTGKGGEFYIDNSLSTDTNANAADSQNNQSCRAIAKLRKAGGNTILPGTCSATVDYEGGKFGFSVTFTEAGEAITDLGEIQCVVSQASMSIPSVQPSTGINDLSLKAQPVPDKKQAAKTVLFAFPDAD
jgi:hypothetical protein